MLSSGTKFYHLGRNFIIWDEMLSSGTKCYHLGQNVIIWDEMLSSGTKFYHLEPMLSSGMQCYHLGCNVIIQFSSAAVATGTCVPVCCNSVYTPHTEYEYVNKPTHTYAALAFSFSDTYFLRFTTETLSGY